MTIIKHVCVFFSMIFFVKQLQAIVEKDQSSFIGADSILNGNHLFNFMISIFVWGYQKFEISIASISGLSFGILKFSGCFIVHLYYDTPLL